MSLGKTQDMNFFWHFIWNGLKCHLICKESVARIFKWHMFMKLGRSISLLQHNLFFFIFRPYCSQKSKNLMIWGVSIPNPKKLVRKGVKSWRKQKKEFISSRNLWAGTINYQEHIWLKCSMNLIFWYSFICFPQCTPWVDFYFLFRGQISFSMSIIYLFR